MSSTPDLRPFNVRRFKDYSLISNDVGEMMFLDNGDLDALLAGDGIDNKAKLKELDAGGFTRGQVSDDDFATRYWDRRGYLGIGPVLHGMVLTERCNLGCQYCHSSVVGMDREDTDMTPEIAEQCVDFALQTTSPGLTIEFQGGEPLANWPVLQHVIDYARKQNETAQKMLSFSLVTNMSFMTDEKLDYLIENQVQICTSIDGPGDLHDKVRIIRGGGGGGSSYADASKWVRIVNQRYKDMGLDNNRYHAEALPTITRHSLSRAKDIVDTYVDLGCRAIFLRILDPFGFASASSKTLGYSAEEFLTFYEEALDYIISLNKKGVQVMERLAAIMLSKMIAGYDPNYLDLRTPGGAIVGQLAYHPSGAIYTSDEGRMVAAMGDEFFRIGHVSETSYPALMNSEITRSMVLASANEQLPGCASCAYKPYCGQQPEYNYVTQGSIQGRMRESTWCKKHMGIFDMLAKRLHDATDEEKAIFDRWTINRVQEHFVQPVGSNGDGG